MRRGFPIARASIGGNTAVNPTRKGAVHLRFMQYKLDGRLVGGVDYAMEL